MKVQHYQPKSELLRKHLEYYYFLRTDDHAYDAKYFAFPNILTPLSIHQNVKASFQPYSTVISKCSEKNHLAIVQGMRTRPLFANLRGKLDKITLVFKPLGLNHFVQRSFSKVCPLDSQIFSEWDNDPRFHGLLEEFYSTYDQDKRVDLVEAFLLSVYQPLQNEDLLQEAITLLTNFENEMSIDEIVSRIGLNRRTFNRIFRDSLGISPVGFRKIARFRHSLSSRLFDEQLQRLTDIACNSNFYDQAYFNNIYKAMTGSNPTRFFREIEKVGTEKLLFRFLGV